MKIIRVGVDLAKSVFQVHGVDRCEKVVWRKKLSRAEWLSALLEKIEPGCEIGMEAVVLHITGLGNCRSEASL
jgi:transposase